MGFLLVDPFQDEARENLDAVRGGNVALV